MTPEQSAAFVNAQTALLCCRVQGMVAENKQREHTEQAMAYTADDFDAVYEAFDGVLGNNGCIDVFIEANR
jgi:hypothetical protein